MSGCHSYHQLFVLCCKADSSFLPWFVQTVERRGAARFACRADGVLQMCDRSLLVSKP